MRYVISDIHGCFKQYKNLLEKIHFTEEDTLYVLGDVVDRGPEPIRVLLDMMKRKNVIYIIGNHDYIMYMTLNRLLNSAKKGGNINTEEQKLCKLWMGDGGFVTIKGFLNLDETARNKVLQYIENGSVYEEVFCEEKKYILVHAGIQNFESDKELDEYEVWDFIEGRTDYSKRYFQDKNIFVIAGHTPTPLIRADRKPEVFVKNGHVAIDCGCVYGGRLAAYCVETGKTLYVNGIEV